MKVDYLPPVAPLWSGREGFMIADKRHRPQEAKDKVFRKRKQRLTLTHASDDGNFAVIKPHGCDRDSILD